MLTKLKMQSLKLQSKIKKFFEFEKPINPWKISTSVLAIILALSLTTNVALLLKSFINKIPSEPLILVDITHPTRQAGPASSFLAKPVSAKEVYPLFGCPCCGKSIDRCSCPMAKERKNYVDSLVKTKSSKDKIVLAYIKKYGLNSFKDESQKEEFKEKLTKEAPADRPIIFLSPETYDLGDVSQKKGKVFTYFNIKNEGSSDLVIDRLETSCGCTFAAVIFRDKEGPYFTMPGHGDLPDWEGASIPPGETAQLKVMYDPNVHKDFRGAAIREIHVFSNDPVDFEKKVSIELNQVD